MESTQWFYLKNGQQRGPVDTGDLASLIHSGVLPPDTLIFTSTQADWIPANTTDVFPLKATTLTTNSNTSRRVNIALIILLLLMLGGGLLVMQQKQSEDKSNNDRAALKEWSGSERGKIQFNTTKPSPRENGAKQNDSGKSQSNGRMDSGNRRQVADDGTLQNQLAVLQRQYASLETKRRAAEKRAESDIDTARKNESRNDKQLARVNIDRLQLDQRLAKANRLNTDLLQRVKLMEANDKQGTRNNAELVDQLREATEELKAAQQKISSLELQLQATKPPVAKAPGRNRPQQIPMVPANAVGNISSVNIQFKVLAINRGSDNGVKNGDAFRIISRTTGAFLGRMTIKRTQPAIAMGTLDGQGTERVRAGDLLFR